MSPFMYCCICCIADKLIVDRSFDYPNVGVIRYAIYIYGVVVVPYYNSSIATELCRFLNCQWK